MTETAREVANRIWEENRFHESSGNILPTIQAIEAALVSAVLAERERLMKAVTDCFHGRHGCRLSDVLQAMGWNPAEEPGKQVVVVHYDPQDIHEGPP